MKIISNSSCSKESRNIVKFKDITNWWCSSLENERAGVAWSGPNPVSTKVGVCWAAATGMAALVEGLAGVENEGLAFDRLKLSPRWCSSEADSADVTFCFPSSGGYVSYCYKTDETKNEISIKVTGSGKELGCHMLLPPKAKSIKAVFLDGESVPFIISEIESSKYADFKISMSGVQNIRISYLN